jgi:tetratricopeptide (TPR) repeat protein
VTPELLDQEVRRDLRGLPKDLADIVARHLVATGELLDEDPAAALVHARFARHRASRVAVVREACGLAAYHAGEWAEALAELRASRRMGGAPHVPVMADAERALGRPERALEIARSPESADLPRDEAMELLIVTSGARRDLGEYAAAVVGLQVPDLDVRREDPWTPRLFYAYGEALLSAGRRDDAVRAFLDAAQTDAEGETDAEERAALVAAGIDTPPGELGDDELAETDEAADPAAEEPIDAPEDADVADEAAAEADVPDDDVLDDDVLDDDVPDDDVPDEPVDAAEDPTP